MGAGSEAQPGKDQLDRLENDVKEGSSTPPACQVCHQQPHKYRCPGCQMQTCSLACSKQHKEQTGCSGKRDKLAFVPMQDFTDKHLMSDYRWLEEVSRADENARRLRPPTPKRELPPHLSSLVHQAKLRGVRLMIMAPGMQRRQHNSTRYDFRNKKISWRIEWKFPAAAAAAAGSAQGEQQQQQQQLETSQPPQPSPPPPPPPPAAAANSKPAIIIDGRVDEEALLCDVLEKHLQYQPGGGSQALLLWQYRPYRQAGAAALTVLMRKEHCPANAVRYYRIDLQQSLKSQLAGKTVIEFPTLLVLLPHEVIGYNIIMAEEQQAELAGFRQGGCRHGGPEQQQQQRWPAPPPPPPRTAAQQQQQQQQQEEEGGGVQQARAPEEQQQQREHGSRDEPAAKRHCDGIGSSAAVHDAAQADVLRSEQQQQQQQGTVEQAAAVAAVDKEEEQQQQQQQQGKQPKYYYYDPTDGVEDDAADLLGGLAEDDEETEQHQQQQQQPKVLGDDAGKAAMMQLLGQYDENEIEIDDA